MAMQWFRLYAEFATDPKVQTMSETFQRRFVMLLCMQCAGQLETSMKRDETQVKRDIAFQMRISDADVTETLAEFERRELINGLKITAWNKRQFKSDVSTERVRKFRKRKGNVSSNVSETPSDTESDTETEQNPSLRSGLRAVESGKNPNAKRRETEAEQMAHVERLKAAYPTGGIHPASDWLAGEREVFRRVDEGHSWEELQAGTERYAAQRNALASDHVYSPKRFYSGHEKLFLQEFPIPRTKAERKQDANIDASLAWLAQQEANDANH